MKERKERKRQKKIIGIQKINRIDENKCEDDAKMSKIVTQVR